MAGAAPGIESGRLLPGHISHHGRAAIRWEKVLDVTVTELGNITYKVTVTDNTGGC
jgi:hypothetical protein